MALAALSRLRCPRCRRPIERVRQHDDRDVFDPFDDGEQIERRRGVAFCPHAGCGVAMVVEVTRRRSMEVPGSPGFREPAAGLVAVARDERVRLRTFDVFTSVHRLVGLGQAVRLVLTAPLLALVGGPRSPLLETEVSPALGRRLRMGAMLGLVGLVLLADGTWSRLWAAYPRALGAALVGLLALAAAVYVSVLASTLREGWGEVADRRLERRSMRHLRDRREVYVEFAPG